MKKTPLLRGLFHLVDTMLKYWNQLENWVFEKYQTVSNGTKRGIKKPPEV